MSTNQVGAAAVCVIRVSDQGRGFNPAQIAAGNKQGFGLFSVEERLKLFGGSMEIVSAPGQGTLITVYAPVATREALTIGN